MQKITVSGIENNSGRIVLHEDNGGKYPVKYSFFINWPDGNPTDVYEEFLTQDVKIGGTYTVEVVEKQGINKISGKPVTYRNITSFGGSTPVGNSNAPQSNDRIERMADWAKKASEDIGWCKQHISDLEAEVSGLQNGAPGSPAYELHKALDPQIKKKIFPDKIDDTIPVIDIEEPVDIKQNDPF